MASDEESLPAESDEDEEIDDPDGAIDPPEDDPSIPSTSEGGDASYSASILSPSALSSASVKGRLRTGTPTPDRFTCGMMASINGRVIDHKEERVPCEGNRIVSLDLLHAHLLPHLCCPLCQTKDMALYQQDEGEAGLAGDLRFRCNRCNKLTIDMPTSLKCGMLGSKHQPVNEVNVRAVLAGYNTGLGFNAFERFCGVLNMPAMSQGTWSTTATYVNPLCEEAGKESMAQALREERQVSFDLGNEPAEGDRYAIPLSFDAQWLKPGRAHNASDGYGVGIGGHTRKVVAADYRTKHGPLKNHEGSSGSMEPIMGAQVCHELSKQGVYVSELCMDLDAKTPKSVREMCERHGLPNPKKKHDPNHYVKVAKGKFIETKKKVKTQNVFPPATQLRLAQQFAMALHQNRKHGCIDRLRGALLQVLKHGFNDHADCSKFFTCPVAEGKRTTSTYKDGLWLSEAGGPAGAKKLKDLLDAVFADLTSDKHMEASLQPWDTQVCCPPAPPLAMHRTHPRPCFLLLGMRSAERPPHLHAPQTQRPVSWMRRAGDPPPLHRPVEQRAGAGMHRHHEEGRHPRGPHEHDEGGPGRG